MAAAAMSSQTRSVWISGTSGHSCFVLLVEGEDEDEDADADATAVQAPSGVSACGSLLLSSSSSNNNSHHFLYGGVQETHRNNNNLQGFLNINEHLIPLEDNEYPLYTTSLQENVWHVMSITTSNDSSTSIVKYPDWLLGRAVIQNPFGESILTVRRLEGQTLVWQSKWPDGATSVIPTGMLEAPEYLVMVGSIPQQQSKNSNLYEGFVTLLDKETSSQTSKRISVGTESWILGLCRDEQHILKDSQYVFLVGASTTTTSSSTSTGTTRAFVQKLRITNTGHIQTAWTYSHEFDDGDGDGDGDDDTNPANPTSTSSLASHCVVSQDKVFVGGTMTQKGQKDVWLAALAIPEDNNNDNDNDNNNDETPTIHWLRQYGSPNQNDVLADFKLLREDNTDNALVVLAETNGDWFGTLTTDTTNNKQLVLATYSLADGTLVGEVPQQQQEQQEEDVVDDHADVDDYLDDADLDDYVDNLVDDLDNGIYIPDTTLDQDDTTDNDGDKDGDKDPFEFHTDDDGPPSQSGFLPKPYNEQNNNSNNQDYGDDDGDDENNNDDGDQDSMSAENNDYDDDTLSTEFHGQGFQSNMGPSYAGGMIYDFARDAVLLSGQTYPTNNIHQSHCMLLEIPMTTLKVTRQKVLETYTSCSPILQLKDEIHVGGIQDKGNEEKSNPLHGIVSSFHWDMQHPDWIPFIKASKLFNDYPVTAPMAMAVDYNGEQQQHPSIFMVSMVSEDHNLSPAHLENQNINENGFPNFTTGGHLKYGSSYSISLKRIYMNDNKEQDQKLSSESILTIHPKDDYGVLFVSGMELIENSLILVGSSMGNVEVLGTGSRNHMDGFLVKVDKSTTTTSSSSSSSSTASALLSKRLAPSSNGNNWIMNLCSSQDNQIYVVGGTATSDGGGYSVHAFVAKMDIDSLESVWIQELKVKVGGSASAFGCSVVPTNHGPSMYVAGVVKNGSIMDYQGAKSFGSDDLFVALVDTSNGNVRWLRQLGSSGHESLARNGGIMVDMDGNAILFGDTTGELYRARSAEDEKESFSKQQRLQSDVFVVTLNKSDGSYAVTVEEQFRREKLDPIVLVSLVAVVLVCVSFWLLHELSSGRKRRALDWLVRDMSSDRTEDESSGLILFDSKNLLSTMVKDRRTDMHKRNSQRNIHPMQDDPLKDAAALKSPKPRRNSLNSLLTSPTPRKNSLNSLLVSPGGRPRPSREFV